MSLTGLPRETCSTIKRLRANLTQSQCQRPQQSPSPSYPDPKTIYIRLRKIKSIEAHIYHKPQRPFVRPLEYGTALLNPHSPEATLKSRVQHASPRLHPHPSNQTLMIQSLARYYQPAYRCILPAFTLIHPRSYAAKKKGGQADASTKFQVIPSSNPNAIPGLDLYKDQEPVIMKQDDSEYPDWLWSVLEPQPTYTQLVHVASRDGLHTLSPPQLKRIIHTLQKKYQRKKQFQESSPMFLDQTIPESEMPDWWPKWVKSSKEGIDILAGRKWKSIKKFKWGGMK